MKNWLETLVILSIVGSVLPAAVGKKSFAGPLKLICALAAVCAALVLPLNAALDGKINPADLFINGGERNNNVMETGAPYPDGSDLVGQTARKLLESRLEEILEAKTGVKLEVDVTGERSVRVRLAGGVSESEVRLVLSVLGAGWEITAEEAQ